VAFAPGISSEDSHLVVRDSALGFNSNRAILFLGNGDLSLLVEGSLITSNTATGSGGGI
jgi:hypothetical protein